MWRRNSIREFMIHNEVTVVLVDNKRSELIDKGFRELLYCIGCGYCLVHCPMYNTIGTDYAKAITLAERIGV